MMAGQAGECYRTLGPGADFELPGCRYGCLGSQAEGMQVTGSPHGRKQPLATFSSGKEPNGRDVWDVPRPRYSGSCSCSPPYGSRLSPAHCCIVQGTAVWGGEGGEGGGRTGGKCGGQGAPST